MDHDGVEWDSDPKTKAEYRDELEKAKAALAAVIIEGDCLAEVALSGPDTEIDKYVALWCKATHDYRALRNASEGEEKDGE